MQRSQDLFEITPHDNTPAHLIGLIDCDLLETFHELPGFGQIAHDQLDAARAPASAVRNSGEDESPSVRSMEPNVASRCEAAVMPMPSGV